jgi:chlorite dismutase
MENPQIHGFLYLRVPPGQRTRHEADRLTEAVQVAEQIPGVAGLYTYSHIGLRPDVDLGFWIAADQPETYQAAARALLTTELERTWSLWGFVRPSQYTGRDGTSVRVPGPRRRFLVVYPFSKTHEWYQLAQDIRRGMMMEHTRLGHGFEHIEQLLLYCTGLADWEFVVGYETDELVQFMELVTTLRSTLARVYTLRDTPTLVGRHGSLDETLARVFGT